MSERGLAIAGLCLIALVAVLLGLVTAPAAAHDGWLSGRKNAAGELCCGIEDCAVMDPKSVALTSGGYVVDGWGTIRGEKRTLREFYREVVPVREALPSPDGAFWRCRRSADKVRVCFFAPPPNT